MKNILLLFIILFGCLTNSYAQSWLWGKNGNGSGNDKAYSVSADPNGNLFVTGSFSSQTITFGSITLTNGNVGGGGDNNVFIVKYDLNGNVLWAKSAGGWGRASGVSVNSDAGGNLFVTGSFNGATITFGSITLVNTGWADMFIVKYDPNGNVIWAKNAKGASLDGATSVSTDISGNVFVTGFFNSDTLTFGNYILTNKSTDNYGTNVFIAKYNANGNVMWAKSAGGTDNYEVSSVSTDSTGNIFLTGSFWGWGPQNSNFVFDSIIIHSSGYWDGFIAKYDANGNALWAKDIGGPHTDYSRSISAEANGNTFVTGFFSDSITIGSIQLTNVDGGYNFFIAKYDANGNALWAKTQVGGISSQGYSISADANGNAFVTGYFQSPQIVFDSISLTPPPANCSYSSSPFCHPMFIVKYDANGNVLCASSLASGNGSSVSADLFGNAYVGGWFGVNPFIVNADTLPFTSTGLQNVFVGKFSCSQQPSLILSQTHTNVLCNGQCTGTASLSASGGTAPYIYSGINSGLCAGNYTFTVTDSNGFIATTTVTITEPNAINVGITAANISTFINSNTDLLAGTPSGGVFSGIGVSGTNFDPSIAGVGIWPVTYIYTDGNGCTDTATTNITVDLSTGGTMNGGGDGAFEVYPNPTSGIFTINLKNNKVETKIFVYDALGNCVLDKVSMKNGKEKIDLTGQPLGIYTLEIVSEGESITKKIVLQ